MTTLFMIVILPFLSMTGIYHPHVMVHGHCIAKPGTVAAMFCEPKKGHA